MTRSRDTQQVQITTKQAQTFLNKVLEIAGWRQDPDDVRGNSVHAEEFKRLVTNDYQLSNFVVENQSREPACLHHIIPYATIAPKIGQLRNANPQLIIKYVEAFDQSYCTFRRATRLGYSVEEIALRIFYNPANLVTGPDPNARSDDPGPNTETSMLEKLPSRVRDLINSARHAHGEDFLKKWTELLQRYQIWQGIWQGDSRNRGKLQFVDFMLNPSLPSTQSSHQALPELSDIRAFPSLSGN